jgi:nucleoid-associated protein YgaU
MRTDVKVGVLFSLVICLVGGLYYLLSDKDQDPIDLSQGTSAPSGENGVQAVESEGTRIKPASRPGGGSVLADRGRQARPTARGVRPAAGAQPRVQGGPPVKQPAHGPQPSRSERPAESSPSASVAQRLPTSARESGRNEVAPDQPERAARQAHEGAISHAAGPRERVADASSQTSSERPTAGSGVPQRLTASEEGSPRSAKADREPPTADRLKKAVNDRHRVQPGDTLAGLALDYYGSEQHAGFLAQANPQIKDPHRLAVGQVIEIPPHPSPLPLVGKRRTAEKGPERRPPQRDDGPAERPAGKNARTYVVTSGDTLYGIAQGLLGTGTRWREIFELNKAVIGDDPDNLRPGQRLIIPPAN